MIIERNIEFVKTPKGCHDLFKPMPSLRDFVGRLNGSTIISSLRDCIRRG